jgi:K+-transporting ATPase KdpF subunit
MDSIYMVCGVVAGGLMFYLFVALFKPEAF